MKIVTNHKRIKIFKRVGQVVTFGSLGILGIGLYISFAKPDLIAYSFVALIAGFILSQLGIFLGNRWGRSPRPDEQITAALKGLDDKYTLYHYKTPVNHLLVGPAGIWAIVPFYQGGTIIYDGVKKRVVQKGGNVYLKIFAQENLGRPEVEATSTTQDIQRFLDKEFADLKLPPAQAAMVFTNPKVSVQASDSPIPAMGSEKLKEFIRKRTKEKLEYSENIPELQSRLPQPE